MSWQHFWNSVKSTQSFSLLRCWLVCKHLLTRVCVSYWLLVRVVQSILLASGARVETFGIFMVQLKRQSGPHAAAVNQVAESRLDVRFRTFQPWFSMLPCVLCQSEFPESCAWP